MSNSTNKSVSVRILGKSYQIVCPEGQEHELLDAAYHLDQKLKETKKQSRVAGMERVILMGALNITHEYLKKVSEDKASVNSIAEHLQNLNKKLDFALIGEK